MRTPPADMPDVVVRQELRAGWNLEVGAVEHLPWGFGAWHWAAQNRGGRRRWFVTADRLDRPGRRAELERAYATARDLSAHLPAVSGLVAADGRLCRESAGFALSVTPWVDGERGQHGAIDEASAAETARFLTRLHALPVPPDAPVWNPRYPSHDVLDDLASSVEQPWSLGPFGEEARALVGARLPQISTWRARYQECAAHAESRRSAWVLTHGEPGPHNQLRAPDGVVWVDWESVRVAPRERDLLELARCADHVWRQSYSHEIDPVNLELFDLAWRLDEIGQYAERFRLSHTGGPDDEIAFGGLRSELGRAGSRYGLR